MRKVDFALTPSSLPPGTRLRFADDPRKPLRFVSWETDANGYLECVLKDKAGHWVNSRLIGQKFEEGQYVIDHEPALPPRMAPMPPRKVKPGDWLASLSSAERKECAVHRGLFAYFPDALAAVARHSVRANEKHNPGQPVHWSREKSSDHADCIGRHTIAVAANPDAMDDGQPEVVCRAWRALADLQIWIEEKHAKGEKV